MGMFDELKMKMPIEGVKLDRDHREHLSKTEPKDFQMNNKQKKEARMKLVNDQIAYIKLRDQEKKLAVEAHERAMRLSRRVQDANDDEIRQNLISERDEWAEAADSHFKMSDEWQKTVSWFSDRINELKTDQYLTVRFKLIPRETIIDDETLEQDFGGDLKRAIESLVPESLSLHDIIDGQESPVIIGVSD